MRQGKCLQSITLFKSKKAQASIDYLLVMLGFFAALAIILPSITQASQSFLSASDSITAKQIADDIQAQSTMLSFLGNGSKKTLEYNSIKEININASGNKIIISTESKIFEAILPNDFVFKDKNFSGKFFVELSKENDLVKINVFSALT